MKTSVLVSLIIFLVALSILVGLGLALRPATVPAPASIGPEPVATGTPATGVVALTPDEVARHNKASDCWIIIEGKVYNVTSVIATHPGGPQAIINNCGKDATTAFQTRGGRGAHPERARAALAGKYIGDLP